ncbi:MAG: hypothetical protein ACLUOI_28895 [Eisenbergiella sp.]
MYEWQDIGTGLSGMHAEGIDAVFLVDSDLILHPALVEYLRATQKGVISELFWSKSCAGRSSGPNAWLMEERAPNSDKRNAALYKKEADRRKKQFADRLKVSGIYEAGGEAVLI